MVRVYKGLVLDVKERKTGTSNSGKFWCLFFAHREDNAKSKESINIFAENPEEAQYYTKAKVGNIIDVSKQSKKRPDGSWGTVINITAHIDGLNETAVRDREAYASFAEAVQGSDAPTKDDLMDFTKAAAFGDETF